MNRRVGANRCSLVGYPEFSTFGNWRKLFVLTTGVIPVSMLRVHFRQLAQTLCAHHGRDSRQYAEGPLSGVV
jgi:hypothetical protein